MVGRCTYSRLQPPLRLNWEGYTIGSAYGRAGIESTLAAGSMGASTGTFSCYRRGRSHNLRQLVCFIFLFGAR